MKKAIIDIGSNSVRLIVLADGIVIFRNKITTQLGRGFAQTGLLQKDAIINTVAAVNSLKQQALKNGVSFDEIYAFATAAVRNSTNGGEFLSLLDGAFNRPIDLLSGELEGQIALLGALEGRDGAVLDIGGASTELCVAKDGKICFVKSMKMGAVLLYDKFQESRNQLEEFIDAQLFELSPPAVDGLVAVGGTSTTCAFIDARLDKYDREITHGRVISCANLEKIVDELFILTQEERITKLKLGALRAKIACGGALILLKTLKRLNLDGVTVSENDNLEGYYKYLQGVRYEI